MQRPHGRLGSSWHLLHPHGPGSQPRARPPVLRAGASRSPQLQPPGGQEAPSAQEDSVPSSSAELLYSSSSRPKLYGAAWIERSFGSFVLFFWLLAFFFFFFCFKRLLGHTPRPKPSPSCTSVPVYTLLLHFHHSQSASLLSSSPGPSQAFCHGSSARCTDAAGCITDWCGRQIVPRDWFPAARGAQHLQKRKVRLRCSLSTKALG